MYFIDIINRNNQAERVYLDRDSFVSKDVLSWEDKNDILLGVLKDMDKRSKERGISIENKPSKSRTKVIASMNTNIYKNGRRVPIFNQKEASDLTIFNDGTYDYNKVRSQDYNDNYFSFKQLSKLLNE